MLMAMDGTKLSMDRIHLHAIQNGFYTQGTITGVRAKAIYALFQTIPLKKYAIQMTFEGPKGFWKNEHYTMLDLTESISNSLQHKQKSSLACTARRTASMLLIK
ncbi:MAG: hypothetical protein IPJ31_07465 [Bacteroidetes bacterium]|nr:hypothetical protein [Bacteroidota bacterium]